MPVEAPRALPPAARAINESIAPVEIVVPRAQVAAAPDASEPALLSAAERRPSNACDWASVQVAALTARRQVKAVVEEATLVEFKDGRVELRIATDLMTAASGAQEEIKDLIGRTWGRTVRVEFCTAADPVVATAAVAERTGTESASGGGTSTTVAAPAMTTASAAEHPLIAKAVELLGAKVMGVYVRQK